jgi:hypothetical protein
VRRRQGHRAREVIELLEPGPGENPVEARIAAQTVVCRIDPEIAEQVRPLTDGALNTSCLSSPSKALKAVVIS